MSDKALRVGICGVGTVGLATLEILRRQSLHSQPAAVSRYQ